MLRREQNRVGAELRTIECGQVALDASLDDWQQVMELAVRFSTRELLSLVAEGRTNSGIASRLWISEGAVEKHVRSILANSSCPPPTRTTAGCSRC
jgi:DNA-binding NarL/FixJ family response regulator